MAAPNLADPEYNPSFTRGVFLGELREDFIFPFPELPTEEKENLTAILDSFRSLAAATVDTHRLDRDGKFGDEVRKGMAELGMMGLNIPEEYGGFGAHQSIGCKGITLFGTDGQKKR